MQLGRVGAGAGAVGAVGAVVLVGAVAIQNRRALLDCRTTEYDDFLGGGATKGLRQQSTLGMKRNRPTV